MLSPLLAYSSEPRQAWDTEEAVRTWGSSAASRTPLAIRTCCRGADGGSRWREAVLACRLEGSLGVLADTGFGEGEAAGSAGIVASLGRGVGLGWDAGDYPPLRRRTGQRTGRVPDV